MADPWEYISKVSDRLDILEQKIKGLEDLVTSTITLANEMVGESVRKVAKNTMKRVDRLAEMIEDMKKDKHVKHDTVLAEAISTFISWVEGRHTKQPYINNMIWDAMGIVTRYLKEKQLEEKEDGT